MLPAWIGWYAHRVPFDEVCDSERTARFSIVPRPLPAQHPTWRRIYLLLISRPARESASRSWVPALAPRPGRNSQPAGAVPSALGIVVGAWIARYACRVPPATWAHIAAASITTRPGDARDRHAGSGGHQVMTRRLQRQLPAT
jgi:hypothetical protein